MSSILLYNIPDDIAWRMKVIALLEHKSLSGLAIEMLEKPLKAKQKKYGEKIFSSMPKKQPLNIPYRLAKKMNRK